MDDGIFITSGYEKPHHRVLKPPGGETHDIFGTNCSASADIAAASQRGRDRSNQSHIFEDNRAGDSVAPINTAATTTTTPAATTMASCTGGVDDVPAAGRRPANGNINGNNMNRIFGGNDQTDNAVPQYRRAAKDHQKSNIFGIGDDAEAVNGNVVGTPQRRPNMNNHEMMSAVGTAHTPSSRRQFAHQIHQAYGNPITGEGYANGSPKIENGNSPAARVRHPPGGHSTNLW